MAIFADSIDYFPKAYANKFLGEALHHGACVFLNSLFALDVVEEWFLMFVDALASGRVCVRIAIPPGFSI
jgi:hypothetical protein